MKKAFYFLATAAALFAVSACGEKPEATIEVPSQIDVNVTTLVKGDVVTGEVNTLPVSATADDVTLELTFYSDKTYLAAGTYTVGTAAGNYQGQIKTKAVEAAFRSGTVTVADDGNDGYTLTGNLLLDNEAGTLVKLNATGTLVYELATEYYYTYETGTDANVYKIFDLENHQLAAAAVVGAEEGTFDVVEGKALPGTADGGTWVWIDGFGTEVYLHGKVTVSTSHGKKVFKFEDNHTRTFANCELKNGLTPVLIKSDEDELNIYSTGILTIDKVPSPVVNGKTEVTFKLFFRDGREFLSAVVLADEDFPVINSRSKPCTIVSYGDYKTYDETAYTSTEGRIVPDGAFFFVANGVKYNVGATSDSNFALVINYAQKGDDIGSVVCPMSSVYALPEALAAVLAGEGTQKNSNCMGILQR